MLQSSVYLQRPATSLNEPWFMNFLPPTTKEHLLENTLKALSYIQLLRVSQRVLYYNAY